MKDALGGLLCLLLGWGTGCALTDYSTITDKNEGEKSPYVVNTNGKAFIKFYPTMTSTDTGFGWVSNHWFVDQKADGGRTLTTMIVGPYPNPELAWVDHKYCSPDWTGCAVWTATDPPGAAPPVSCEYDGKGNPSCEGFSSLLFLYCGQRNYGGECGRAGFSTADLLQVANMGRPGQSLGMEGLFYDINAKNLTLVLDNNAGYVATIPVRGNAVSFYSPRKRAGWLDITNPLIGSTGRSYADFLAEHGTGGMTATLVYNGISRRVHFKPVGGSSKVLQLVNRAF